MGRHGVAETLTGALVLVVALAFLAYAVAHSGRTAGSGYTLKARFDHIDGLAVGGDVRIAGVKVGTVTDERIDPKTVHRDRVADGAGRHPAAQGYRGPDPQRKPAGRQVHLAVAGRR